MVIRQIPFSVKTFADLGLPPVIAKMADKPRGLVLVTGPTGSGKSTTLAAMIDWINRNREVHVITIEDPIEVLHNDVQASVNQREIGVDTSSFANAMRAAMRQDPDVILVGEMRDQETVAAALSAAETGHLVLSTLHTIDASETINRIVDFFPPHQQNQIRVALAGSLRGIVCQRLVPTADGIGRVAAIEVMVNNGRTQNCIVNQREVGTDTKSFSNALKYALREDPDVVLIGELRDQETIAAALTIAETGHLAFATLHTNSATEAINRIIDVFPSHQQEQVRTQLRFVLEGIITQTLLPRAKGRGRVMAAEILVMTPAIRALIKDAKFVQFPGMMQAGK
jgi:twitching motility protein PilT